jgi:twitching motility protein PilT
MAKIDVYLRSIERFGASGAVLTSGQSVTLRFPTGDRHATQVTPHDQLVTIIREVAPPAAIDQIDANRSARFDVDSNGTRYTLAVVPRPGAWEVAIEPAADAPAPPVPPAYAPTARPAPRAASAPTAVESDLAIERGQYAGDSIPAQTMTGNPALEQLVAAARGARATDIYLATGAVPMLRVAGELREASGALDGETISRELGNIAPAAARGAWSERGIATFAYREPGGRVRVTLVRDERGPGAALRLLVAEPPQLERIGVPREVGAWLQRRGVVLVAGGSGVGKTTVLAALVAAFANNQRRVVTIEDPIEILHASPWISQRAVGEHVPHVAAGVAVAMREGADAIAIGEVTTPAAATALVDAAAAGHLVLATVATSAAGAREHLLELLPSHRTAHGRRVLDETMLGAVAPIAKGASRSFEVVAARD